MFLKYILLIHKSYKDSYINFFVDFVDFYVHKVSYFYEHKNLINTLKIEKSLLNILEIFVAKIFWEIFVAVNDICKQYDISIKSFFNKFH